MKVILQGLNAEVIYVKVIDEIKGNLILIFLQNYLVEQKVVVIHFY